MAICLSSSLEEFIVVQRGDTRLKQGGDGQDTVGDYLCSVLTMETMSLAMKRRVERYCGKPSYLRFGCKILEGIDEEGGDLVPVRIVDRRFENCTLYSRYAFRVRKTRGYFREVGRLRTTEGIIRSYVHMCFKN